jgi:hypothetical protein
MKTSQPIDEQVAAGLARATAAGFGDEIWLTFYLSGGESDLALMAAALQDDEWTNTAGSESGFLYPKKHAAKTVVDVLRLGRKVEEFCDLYGVELISIDADSQSDVQGSRFITLYSP